MGPSSGTAPRKGLTFHLATSPTASQDQTSSNRLLVKCWEGQASRDRQRRGGLPAGASRAAFLARTPTRDGFPSFVCFLTVSRFIETHQRLKKEKNNLLSSLLSSQWEARERLNHSRYILDVFGGRGALLSLGRCLGLPSPSWCFDDLSPFPCGILHSAGKIREVLKAAGRNRAVLYMHRGWGGV